MVETEEEMLRSSIDGCIIRAQLELTETLKANCTTGASVLR